MANKPEIVQEFEDEEDGPPPGFQSIITQQAPQSNLPSGNAEGGDGSGGEEEGPPPGFHCMNLPPPHSGETDYWSHTHFILIIPFVVASSNCCLFRNFK